MNATVAFGGEADAAAAGVDAGQRPLYGRILLKLSGEALAGEAGLNIDPAKLKRVTGEVTRINKSGVSIAIVIGGGNFFRGSGLAERGMDRVTADHIGMMATIINALALKDEFHRAGVSSRVQSAVSVRSFCEDYIRGRAVRHLEKGRIVIFAGGTGNPLVSTDTAASLRSIEIGADVLFKATNVDGVYDSDPKLSSTARRYRSLGYDEAISKSLGVMDIAAIALCRENKMPVRVFDINRHHELSRAVFDSSVGTLMD